MSVRRPRWLLSLIFIAAVPARAAAPEPAKPKVGILGITVEGDQSAASTFLDVLVTQVAQTNKFEVISKNEINAMIGLERMKDLTACSDASCMAEIGGALGVERLIAGSVAKLGEAFVVNLQLINVSQGRVDNRVSMKWDGPQIQVVEVIGAAAQELVLEAGEKKPGQILVTQLVGEAIIYLDNQPAAAQMDDLAIGPHQVKITADGYQSKIVQVVIKSGALVTLDGSLTLVDVTALGRVRNLGAGVEFEIVTLQDALLESEGLLMHAVVQGTYRLMRWLSFGARAAVGVNGAELTGAEPWPTTTTAGRAFIPGLFVASSPLFEPNLFEGTVEAGADLHFRKLELAAPTLPAALSIVDGGAHEPAGMLFGVHAGLGFDYHVSPFLTLGLAVRYYWVPGSSISFNGEEFGRSLSGLAIAPRLIVRVGEGW